MQIRLLYMFLFIFGIKTQAQTIVNGTGETLSPENYFTYAGMYMNLFYNR